MAKQDLIIHLCGGISEVVDSSNVAFHNQADLEITPPTSPDPVDDAITGHKNVFLRECVCRLEPGPDAFDAKSKVFIFEYFRLDDADLREGSVPIRFALHIAWDDPAVYLADIVVYLTGGATNKDPVESTGGTVSTTELQSGLYDAARGVGLYDDIEYDEHKPAAEGGSGDTEYRVIRIVNNAAGAVDLDVWIENPDDPDPAAALDGYGYAIALGKDESPFVADSGSENTDPVPDGAVYNAETRNSPLTVTGVTSTGLGICIRRTVPVDP